MSISKTSTSKQQIIYRYYVSLDAHKRSYFVKIVDSKTKKVLFNHGIVGSIDQVISRLKILKLPKKDTLVLYEAGCVGFHPYWNLRENGYTCLVIAPSSIPHNNRLRKSDKSDAGNNLNYHLSGLLRYVTVPDKDTIHIRELNRYRDRLVDKIKKQKQQVSAFTLRYGHIFTETKSDWSKTHRKWLQKIKFAPTLQVTFDFLLDELAMLEERLCRCEKEIRRCTSVHPQVQEYIEKLELLPGIGTITAQTLTLECGDMSRFERPDQISRFLGLIPGLQQSGTSNPARSITKEGNELARRMVISASKFYGDRRCLYTRKELAGFPPRLAEFIGRLQNRLNFRYRYLRDRGKHVNKVRCAVARELIMFLWEYTVFVLPALQMEIHKERTV